ncbi:ABC-type multidrug transport system fused ATPase/permease subunit [Streptosporangium becharense]|uniref:ABC-type multidrug transport system fused ATPase/permease subunit n=2 Tax=Streptosporangium becharense TaxID=1816182 RepID=A0A7W9ICN2_9ACTN|nr:ABC-type multidrug transport system fused ATPase/permease subunit [Streptosporangium becharense]MBB5818269.1 ABC-type multidrug transport system fused ATPase/permease subunit [Streptosporangium becharense]
MTSAVMRQGLRLLGVAIRTEKAVFAAAALSSALYGVMTVASAWALGWATENAVLPAFRRGDITTATLTLGTLLILGTALLKALGVSGRRYFAGVMQYRMQARSRRDVTRQYLRLPLAWHHRHPTGQLLSNASADVEAAWAPLAPLPMAVGVVIMLVTAAVGLVITDPVLALVGFLIFPAIAVLNLVYQRRLNPLATRAQQLRAEVSEIAHESFDGALVVKTLGREDEEAARFRAKVDELRDANIAVGRVRGLFDPVLEALPTIGVLAVLLIGAARLESGAIEAGVLVEVAYLFTLLAFPIRALGWVLAELPRAVVGHERVTSVLEATGSMEHGAAELPGSGPARLEVRGLEYAYDDFPVLRDVDLAVEPGRTVALVGPTGSGKSTLTQTLVRLVDPVRGAVLVDGVDLRDVARGGVSDAVALVPQQTFLFDDTVRGNVTLGLPVGDDEVWAALRLAQAEGFVSALPSGLDTRVGERGATLSGGQRQRIALARALVRRPRLLVLDDATSSVDPQVEARILYGLRDAAHASTVVVVAYRMATIALADEVVYLHHGRVVDRGPHRELIARCEGYRNLVTAYERQEAEREALGAEEEEEVTA